MINYGIMHYQLEKWSWRSGLTALLKVSYIFSSKCLCLVHKFLASMPQNEHFC